MTPLLFLFQIETVYIQYPVTEHGRYDRTMGEESYSSGELKKMTRASKTLLFKWEALLSNSLYSLLHTEGSRVFSVSAKCI